MVISNSKFPERGRIKKKVVYPVIFLRTMFFSSLLELKLTDKKWIFTCLWPNPRVLS